MRHVHLGHGPGLYHPAGREREFVVCESCGAVRAVAPAELDDVRAAVLAAVGYRARFTHFPLAGSVPRVRLGGRRISPHALPRARAKRQFGPPVIRSYRSCAIAPRTRHAGGALDQRRTLVTVPHLIPAMEASTAPAAFAAVRAHGLRLSSARRLLLQALFAADRPLSAEELAGDGDVASAYRNLEVMPRARRARS